MGNPQESLSREFVAGLVTGEGWFGVTVQKTPRLKAKNGFTLMPRFAIQMDDTETMDQLIATFREWGLAFYCPRLNRTGTRVEIVGVRRLLRFLDIILPVLRGRKAQSATVVRDFIVLRLGKSQPDPYGPEEFALVNRLRSLNAGNGKRTILPRVESSETLCRIPPTGG
jgi:hypothetical protein